MSPFNLDAIDRQLLDLMQDSARLTPAYLAERVNLSESAVRRRVEILRSRGVIACEVAILAPELIGGVHLIVSVSFERESPEIYERFRQRMRALPEVMQCYSVAGAIDFVLIVRAKDLQSFEAWGERELMQRPEIRRYDSQVVWSTVKFTTKCALS
jgi:Lrp/AsnC family transcriptional regulator, leucine-responsive regulatory protein